MDQIEVSVRYDRAVRLLNSKRATSRERRSAVQDLTDAAEAGFAAAAASLGDLYQFGRSWIDADLQQAAVWYKRAAALGEGSVCYYLAMIYMTDLKDPAEAAIWLRRSAEADPTCGDPMYYLGSFHAEGRGVEQDDRQALRWFVRGGLCDDGDSLYALSRFVREGRATVANEADAETLVAWAAVNDSGDARYSMACRQLADGLIDDALENLEDAADEGVAPAAYLLGTFHEQGKYVDEDLEIAVERYGEAASQGHSEAAEALRRLAAQGFEPMADEDVSAGEVSFLPLRNRLAIAAPAPGVGSDDDDDEEDTACLRGLAGVILVRLAGELGGALRV